MEEEEEEEGRQTLQRATESGGGGGGGQGQFRERRKTQMTALINREQPTAPPEGNLPGGRPSQEEEEVRLQKNGDSAAVCPDTKRPTLIWGSVVRVSDDVLKAIHNNSVNLPDVARMEKVELLRLTPMPFCSRFLHRM